MNLAIDRNRAFTPFNFFLVVRVETHNNIVNAKIREEALVVFNSDQLLKEFAHHNIKNELALLANLKDFEKIIDKKKIKPLVHKHKVFGSLEHLDKIPF